MKRSDGQPHRMKRSDGQPRRMRKSDKKDFLTILIMWAVGMGLVWAFTVLIATFARAETILNYEVCRDKECRTGEIVGPDGEMMSCVMMGQHIIRKHMEEKAMHGFTIKKWTCKVGKPSLEA